MSGLFELERNSRPQVLNRRHRNLPSDAVYIGRGSPWGNPYRIGVDGDRTEVIRLFKERALADPEFIQKVKEELAGKDLICYCAPAPCHGDVLVEIANH